VRSRPGPLPFGLQLYVPEEDADIDPPMYSLFIGGARVNRAQEVDTLVDHALWEVEQRLFRSVRDFLLIHAGVVGTPTSATVVLPGGTGLGKSTLVAALLVRGFTYLSDELAPLDPVSARVYPYHRPIALKSVSLPLLQGLTDRVVFSPTADGPGRPYLRPQDIGASVGNPGPVASVVFPSTDRDGRPRLVPIPAAETLRRLAENSVNLGVYQDRGLTLLSRILRTAETFELQGGTPEQRAELLAERFLHT
jgi:hypothetical protein